MLEIPDYIYKQILKQARDAVPIEACGILAGLGGKVDKLYAMANTDKSNKHFTMEPAEQFSVVKDIRGAGREMLAIYHSHPETPARLSAEDIRMAFTPGVFYVIISLQDEEASIKGFLIDNGNVKEATVEIVED